VGHKPKRGTKGKQAEPSGSAGYQAIADAALRFNPGEDRLLTSAQYARIRGYQTEQAARRERWAGGPLACPFVKIGRKVYYKNSSVMAFIAGLPTYQNTAQVPGRDSGVAAQGAS
jgi:hypothetical protein